MANFRFQKQDDLTETISNLEEFRREGYGDLPGEKEREKMILKRHGRSFDYECILRKKRMAMNRKKKLTYKDRVRTLYLRRNMNNLDRINEEKKFFLLKTKEDLDNSMQRMESIQKQKMEVEAEIQMEKDANNNAAVFRLQARYQRLCTELKREKELEEKISAIIKENERTMWHIEIEEGKFSPLQEALKTEEAKLGQLVQQQAEERLLKANMAAEKIAQNKAFRIQKALEDEKNYELHCERVKTEAKKNNRIAQQFLRTTLMKNQKKQNIAERLKKAHMKKRMDTMISLKKNIAINQEIMKKLMAWDKAKKYLDKQKKDTEREAILAEGGDDIKLLLHRKQKRDLENKKRIFAEEQRLRKCEIVNRLLKEEAYDEKIKQRQQDLESGKSWRIKAKKLPSQKERTWTYLMDLCDGKTRVRTPVLKINRAISDFAYPRSMSIISTESSMTGDLDTLLVNLEEETLAEPEIMGLWNEAYKPYNLPKDEVERKPLGGTKMDQDIFAGTLEKLRRGIVHRQVVSGREFKGCPFYSKPDLIHFKNFDIGKRYKKKMTLINASYTINYCKLVGVDEHLKDFITIDFDPPGGMSAGISCEVVIIFKPMINKDLHGRVTFLAQTGEFSVPLKCTTKKCLLFLENKLINFGTYVVGETAVQTITLGNRGALGTQFYVRSKIETPDFGTKSPNVIASSLYSLDDRSVDDKSKSTEAFCIPSIDIIPAASPATSEYLSDDLYQDQSISIEEILSERVPSSIYDEQTEIKLGEIRTNDIKPFGSVQIPVIFTPTIPGPSEAKFQIFFKNPDCRPLFFRAIGVAIIVPVWVPRPNVDMKICMYDRLYQEAIIIQTRSKAALRLKFEVCKELKKHIELLPETGYIQAQSSYSVQLKFLPRQSLPEDAGKYFDKETRVLQAPITIRVADQKRPVHFTVHAIVTTTDLEIEPKEVNFGYCTIYEAVYADITLTNKSFLPQEYGFTNLPQYVEIQPNDGFGTILPLESLPLNVIFKPHKAKEYNFQLVCITEINRAFTLSCKGIGVHPPLELSDYRIKFAATALFDSSVASLYVINSHTSMNSLTHAVPRIGMGEVAPVGPTSFEFLLPPNAPIKIMPSVGTLLPGKKCMIQVVFSPTLAETVIKKEVVRMRNVKLGVSTVEKKESTINKKPSSKKVFSTAPLKAAVKWLKPRFPQKKERPKPIPIKTDSEEYYIAKSNLVNGFKNEFIKYLIPCIVASGDVEKNREAMIKNFSPQNTLYLELYCATVAPAVIVASHQGMTVFNFGEIAVGHRDIKRITLQNVCQHPLELEFSIPNPFGPFILLCPCRSLDPNQKEDFAVSFSPRENTLFFENLEIMTNKGTLTLSLLGKGVASTIACSIEGDFLNMGYVIAGESATMVFKLQNNSTLPIKFSLLLESLSLMRIKEQQQLPSFVDDSTNRTNIVGTQNYSGQSVFSVSPIEGTIEPGKTQDCTLTFSPDHESLYYSDKLKVVLFNKKISQEILLKGAAREHMMYVEGGDLLDVAVESLAVIPPLTEEEIKEGAEVNKAIILTLEYKQKDSSPSIPATRELHVGCIRTNQPTQRKNIEFSMESSYLLQHKGFTVEPTRGMVERGQMKTIKVSWVPMADFDPDQPLVTTSLLIVRGYVKETYRIVFIARVVSEWLLGDTST